MSFLLDTNILSAHLRRPAGLAHYFFQHSGQLSTSTLCLAELYVWVCGRSNRAALEAAIDQLLKYEVAVIDYDLASAKVFGDTRVALRRQGVEVNTTDLFIASMALAHNLTLVTHNTADFQSITGLRLADWLSP